MLPCIDAIDNPDVKLCNIISSFRSIYNCGVSTRQLGYRVILIRIPANSRTRIGVTGGRMRAGECLILVDYHNPTNLAHAAKMTGN